MRKILLLALIVLLGNYIYAQTTYYAKANGNWNVNTTWTTAGCSGGANAGPPGATDNVVICGGFTVTLAANTTINNLEIQSGNVLNTSGKTLDINGNLIVDGSLISDPSSGKSTTFTGGSGKTISGSGVIDVKDVGGKYFIINGDAQITSSSSLTIVNTVKVNAGTTSNYGNVYVGINLLGVAGSTWNNKSGSKISINGTLMSSGTLIANESNNTVEYVGSSAQNITTPSGNTYYNLAISNSAAAPSVTQLASLIVNGDFTINTGTYETSTFDLTIGGNFSNSGTFNYNTRTVTLNGAGNQVVTNSSGQSFYNLTIDKATGEVQLANNVVVRNIFTMTKGDINAGSNRITVGYSTVAGQEGTLSYTSGAVIGEYEKYVRASGSVTFPVGVSAYDRPAVANFTMTAAGSVIAKFWASPPGNNGMPLVDASTATWVYNTFSEGYWALTSANGFTVSSYNLELTGSGFNSFTIDPQTRVLVRANSGSAWIAQGTHVLGAGFTAKRSGMTTLGGQYCLGDDTFCSRPTTSAISGDNSVCVNDVGVAYSVTNTPLSWYEWSISPSSAGVVNSTGSNSVTIDWGAVGCNATLKVVELNSCTWGDTVYYSVTVGPVAPTSISGSSSVPVGATGKTYSVTNLGYTYNWSVVGGTIIGPTSGTTVTVNWDNTEGTGSISVVAHDATCGDAAPVTMNVRRYYVIKSIANGSWTNTATWDCGCVPLVTDNVQIRNHTVTLPAGSDYTINNLIIDATGVLSMSVSNPSKSFYIDGDLTLNGSITGSKHTMYLRGVNKEINGTGNFNQTTIIYVTGGAKTIASTAVLTVASSMNIAAGLSVYNYGYITIPAFAITGNWVNKNNSTLITRATFFPATTDFTSAGNTVVFNRTGSLQNIPIPSNNQFYNITFAGDNSKVLQQNNVIVSGNFSITESAIIDPANSYNISIGGNWSNTGIIADPFRENTRTITLNGSSDQTVTCSVAGGEAFYNLIVNKTSGSVILANNVTVSNQLTMTQGNIDCGANRIIVGTGTGAAAGTLSYTTGTIIGEYEKWTNGAATYLFPLGTSTYYRPVSLVLSGVTNGSIISKFVESSYSPAGQVFPINDGIVDVIDEFSDGYWQFVAANSFVSTSFNIDVTATSFTSGGAYTVNSASRILKSDNLGTYTMTGTHVNGDGTVCHRTGITTGINTDVTNGTRFCIGHTNCSTITPPVITGVDNTCSGSTEIYSIPNTGNSYVWTISGGTTDPNPTAGQGTYQVTVTWSVPLLNASVSVVESSGCYVAPASSKTVVLHNLPVGAISGPNSVPEYSLQGPYTVTARPGYTYTWSIAIGNGSITSGQGTNSVYISWTDPCAPATLRCVGVYTVTDPDCVNDQHTDYSVTVNSSIVTQADGNWSNSATWVGGNVPDVNTESARVLHNVTVDNSYTINSLYIDVSGTVTHNSGRDITIIGGYYNYGTHDLSASGTCDLNLTATTAGAIIGGNGMAFTTPGNIYINGNNHTIATSTDMIIVGDVSLGNSITVNNYGIFTIYGNLLDANNPGSTWINEANSTLNVYEGLLASRGTLIANSSNNTVAYIGDAAQNIKTPNSNKYWNLTITTDGAVANTKTMQAALDLDGTLRIGNNAALSTGSNYQLNIGGDWINTSANANAFTENSGTVIFDGSGNQSISNALGETFYRLEIASQGDVTLSNGNITISNLLTLTKGALITSNYRVIIPAGSSSNAGDADSFVDGYVRKTGNTAFTFPTGDKTTEYFWAPVGLASITSGAGDYFEATFKRTSPPNSSSLGTGIDHISSLEYWDVTPSNVAATADVLLYWKNAARSGITDISSGDLAIAHWTGSEWENKNGTIWGGSTVGVGGSGYISTNLTSFSPIAHAAKIGINPLPVDLLYFNAVPVEKDVEISWATASEINCDYFLIQKTKDFNSIDDVGYYKGNGNSSVKNTYSTQDRNPYGGLSYYRLLQVDYNGDKNYSNWVPVNINFNNDMEVFPNPVNRGQEFFINLKPFENEEALVVVRDILGNELYSKVVIVNQEENLLIAVDLEKQIPPGVYIIIGTSRNQIFNKKIVIR